MKQQPVYDRIRKLIEWTPKSKKLLDIGCDRGDITARFKSKAKEVYGVDNNPQAIAHAKKTHKGVKFVLAKGEKIPFANNYFDTIIMGDVLEHVENERKTLNEVYRVLKPGGTLVLCVPHKGLFGFVDSFNLKFYFPNLYKLWKGKNYNPKVYKIQPWHRHYSIEDLKRLFGKRFTVERVHRGGLILTPVIWITEDVMTDRNIKSKTLNKILNNVRHVEYQMPFGRFGYHIILRAKKLQVHTP